MQAESDLALPTAEAAGGPKDGTAVAGFCRIVAESLGVPAAFVGVVHDGGIEILAGQIGDGTSRPNDVAFAAAVADAGRLVVADAASDVRFGARAGGARFMAGVAFDMNDPTRRGVLAVGAPEPRHVSADEIDRLERYARLAAVLLRTPVPAPGAVEAVGEQARLMALKDRELARRHRLLMQAETLARIGGWDYELEGGSGDWSDQMFAIFDLPPSASPPLAAFVGAFAEDSRDVVAKAIDAATKHGAAFDVEAPLITHSGQLKVIRLMGEAEVVDGRPRRLFGIAQDVTERKRNEERNWRLANHDFLTRLPNRRLFEEMLERAIEFARVDGSRVGLLIVDLDYFKEINASLGHEVGDTLLHVVAGRLKRLTPGDEVARVGGDEFGVLIRDLGDPARLFDVARALIQAVEQPVMIRDREVACRASVGGALFPDHARSANDLIARATSALERAKTTGRRIAVVYDEEMRRETDTRFRIHEAIRGALTRDEIFPYYQPKISLKTGRLVGLEALVRWRTAPGGIVMPAEFNAALADGFLGSAIGTRVIEKVTDDICGWLDAGLPFGSVAVNASAIELMRGAYHEQVSEILTRKQIPFHCFQVEVTETVFVQHEGHEIRDTVRRLDAMGVRVALDDFGTGFGSLVHLRRLAVSEIKIDRSFIAGIDSDEEDYLIVKSLIELGHGLGKTVVAEGIESDSERLALRALGCDLGQGFLFSLPLPRQEATRYLVAEAAD